VQFLIVIVAVFAATWLIPPRSRWSGVDRWRIALALGMVVAGVSHLIAPTPFLQYLPEWLPLRSATVFVSGLVEIALGTALLVSTRWRLAIGWALAAYLVAVFPGNIYAAVASLDVQGQPDGIYVWLRLLLQPLFVWLALWSTGAGAVRRSPTVGRGLRSGGTAPTDDPSPALPVDGSAL
jgi:uncharacterized membrane protein